MICWYLVVLLVGAVERLCGTARLFIGVLQLLTNSIATVKTKCLVPIFRLQGDALQQQLTAVSASEAKLRQEVEAAASEAAQLKGQVAALQQQVTGLQGEIGKKQAESEAFAQGQYWGVWERRLARSQVPCIAVAVLWQDMC
jgi:hypothetical protein